MSKPTTQRPPQVTFAAGLVVAGSLFVVLGNFSRVSTLRSLDNRELVEELVSEPALGGLGLSVEDGFTFLYASLVVGAVFAAMAAVFGGYALTGSRPARLGATLVAVPMFLSGLVNAGFTTALVAAAASMLWLSPGREWFRDGVWTPPAPPGRDDRAVRPAGGPHGQSRHGQPPYDRAPHDPTPHDPVGQTGGPRHPGPRPSLPAEGAAQPGPHPGWLAGPAGQPAPHHRRPAEAGPRPQSLRTVLLLTVLGGLAASFSYVRAAVTADHGEQFETFREQFPGLVEQAGYTADMFRVANYVTAGMMVLWAVAAVVLAVLVLRRQEWARILLLVSAALTAPFCLLSGLAGDVLLLLPGVAALVTFVALRQPDVKAWVNRR